MPRASNGTYTLPAGNPVVTLTTISSTWANTTLEDLADAMTDSLSRTGDGGMQAPLELDSGAVGAPGLSWSAETTSGLYRAGAGDFRYSISSADVIQIVSGALRVPAGSAATPSLSILTDTNTGIYSVGADNLGFSIGGTLRLDITTTAFTATLPWRGPNGSAAAPTFSFSGDTDNGVYLDAANQIGVSTGGTRRFVVFNTGVQCDVNLTLPDGSAGTPAVAFSGDANTGFYRASSDQIDAACNGTRVWRFAATFASSDQPFYVPDGSVGTPSYSFNSDPDIGMYRIGANLLGFAVAGAFGLEIRNFTTGGPAPSSNFIAISDAGTFSVPATTANFAFIYVDPADGDLKVKFGDGTVKTIVTDT